MISESTKELIVNRQKVLPVNVYGLAEDMGIAVREIPKDDNFSGRLSKKGDGEYLIEVNSSHPKVRKRFTVAHEIGHFLYHRDKLDGELVDDALYRSGLSSALETQANKFAARLLMPLDQIEEIVKSEEIKNVETLARRVGVSEMALRIRLGMPLK